MNADLIPEIVGPFSNVVHQLLVDVPTPSAEEAHNVGGSVVSGSRDSPAPAEQSEANVPADDPLLFAARFSREPGQLGDYSDRAPLAGPGQGCSPTFMRSG